MSKELVLPTFQKAVAALMTSDTRLNSYTVYRYANGQLPKSILFLAEHPEIAQALADDAKALADARHAQSDLQAA